MILLRLHWSDLTKTVASAPSGQQTSRTLVHLQPFDQPSNVSTYNPIQVSRYPTMARRFSWRQHFQLRKFFFSPDLVRKSDISSASLTQSLLLLCLQSWSLQCIIDDTAVLSFCLAFVNAGVRLGCNWHCMEAPPPVLLTGALCNPHCWRLLAEVWQLASSYPPAFCCKLSCSVS